MSLPERLSGSAQYFPDGKRIVTISGDNTAEVWDAQTSRLLYYLQGYHAGFGSFEFSPDGTRIVTASADGSVKIWDAEKGWPLYYLKGHTAGVNSTQYSPDGKWIVTASNDTHCKLWDAKNGKEQLSLTIIDSTDWVVTTPSGLFDASPGAMKKLCWVKGSDALSLDRFKDKYWIPGLWKKVMERKIPVS